jgi:hypothetical protein
LNPEFADTDPIDVFDLWEGANMRLRIRKHEGYRNYDKTDFADPSPIANTDEEIESIWKKAYSLQEIVDPKNFKSYEELSKRLQRVLNTKVGSSPAARIMEDMEDDEVAASPSSRTSSAKPVGSTAKSAYDDDDDTESYFNNLIDDED